MSDTPTDSDGLPWYLKVVMVIAALVVLFIIAIDFVTFASQL